MVEWGRHAMCKEEDLRDSCVYVSWSASRCHCSVEG